jgi:hypothetical protein
MACLQVIGESSLYKALDVAVQTFSSHQISEYVTTAQAAIHEIIDGVAISVSMQAAAPEEEAHPCFSASWVTQTNHRCQPVCCNHLQSSIRHLSQHLQKFLNLSKDHYNSEQQTVSGMGK